MGSSSESIMIDKVEISKDKINLLYYINMEGNKCKSIHKAKDFDSIKLVKHGKGFYQFMCNKTGWKPTLFIATISQ